MADTAAHLVDRVLPEVPIRQWVLSLPFALRYRLAFDPGLTAGVLGVFVRVVFASLRRRARRQRKKPGGRLHCGAVTFVQRFGDALNLNVHFHTLALDGMYAEDGSGDIHFIPLPPPEDPEVARVAVRIARQLAKLLERHGLGSPANSLEADPFNDDQPLLAALYGASVRGRIATGPRAGQRVTRIGDRIDIEAIAVTSAPRCANVAGISLHANVCVVARDRSRLERLCRYVARPPVATERLSSLPDGRLLYRLRHRWRDGSTHVVFQPIELIEKLAALIPRPRLNLVRYHGVLAPAARWRKRIVPAGPGPETLPTTPEHPGCTGRPCSANVQPIAPRPRNYTWAELMRRVFSVGVLECPQCSGRMRILAAIQSSEAIRAILDCLSLPSRSPPIAAAAPDEIDLTDWSV